MSKQTTESWFHLILLLIYFAIVMDPRRYEAPSSFYVGIRSNKKETTSILFSSDSVDLPGFLLGNDADKFVQNRKGKAGEKKPKKSKQKTEESFPVYGHTSDSCLTCIRHAHKTVPNELRKALLEEHFKYTTFREGQDEAIEAILSNESTIAVLPTGTGKSLCFQLPLLALRIFYEVNAFCLVISPLISIMEDQLASLPAMLKGVILSRSSMNPSAIATAIADGALSVLFISPERLGRDDALLNALQTVQHLLAFVVLDEAHCMSQWGHDFRPSFHSIPMRIDSLRSKSFEAEHSKIQWIALTATATVQVLDELQSVLKASKVIKYTSPRQNLILHAHPLSMQSQQEIHAASMAFSDNSSTTQLFQSLFMKILDFLREKESYPVILYINTQQRAEEFASFILRRQNDFSRDSSENCSLFPDNFVRVSVYHAGLGQKQRSEIQKKFLSGDIEIIVATIAFGMGLNKKNIRKIIHLSLPASPEQYVQEIGRGGRDGMQCHCHLILHPAFYFEARRYIVKSICQIDILNSVCDYLLGNRDGKQTFEFAIDFLHLQQITLLDEPTLVTVIRAIEAMAPEYIFLTNKQNLSSEKMDRVGGKSTGQTYRFASISFKDQNKKRKKFTLPDITVRRNSCSHILHTLDGNNHVYNLIKSKSERSESFQLDIFEASEECGVSYFNFVSELQSLEGDGLISVLLTMPVCVVNQLQTSQQSSRRLIARSAKFFLDERSINSTQKLNCIFGIMNSLASGSSSEDTHSTLESYFSLDMSKLSTRTGNPHLRSLLQVPKELSFDVTMQERAAIQSITHRICEERTHMEILHVLYGIGPNWKENQLFGKFSHLPFDDVSSIAFNELKLLRTDL